MQFSAHVDPYLSLCVGPCIQRPTPTQVGRIRGSRVENFSDFGMTFTLTCNFCYHLCETRSTQLNSSHADNHNDPRSPPDALNNIIRRQCQRTGQLRHASTAGALFGNADPSRQ